MWWLKRLIFLSASAALICFHWSGCTEKVSQHIRTLDQITLAKSSIEEFGECHSVESYYPDTSHLDHTPVKYIRVNLHFMNSSDSTRNYSFARAKEFGPKMIKAANEQLEDNRKMAIPIGNNTPVLPTRYQYEITASAGYEKNEGIYCHYDDDLYWFVSRGKNRNNYDRRVIKSYGIGLDSIINLFVVPHHPDSVTSTTYSVTSAGIALGTAVKIAGVFESRKKPHRFKGLINHEIGHVLGLRHTWNSNDGCDDTPRNPNCWNTTEEPPCDTFASNNLMDYNAHQYAWTPCQIGKIQSNMSKETSIARKVLVPNWCRINPSQSITIRDSVSWYGAKDLEGNLEVADGGILYVHCRLSLPSGAMISVAPGGKLVLQDAKLHNACGKLWQGIQVHRKGNKEGVVNYVGSTTIENVDRSDSSVYE